MKLMKPFLIILGFGLSCTGSKVMCAESGPPADQRRTGYVHDTSINPFIVTGDGKELGDPMPVYWDGVWHLYALSTDFRMVLHFTSTDLVKWVEHKPAMAGKDICAGTVEVERPAPVGAVRTDMRTRRIITVGRNK